MNTCSERDDAILQLGKRLVAELSQQGGADTLCEWMAHDIAELMHAAETADEVDAPAARAACRTAILALWAHRSGVSDRLASIGSLKGWTRFLRSRGNPFLHFEGGQSKTSDEETVAETYLALALRLRDATDPMVRAALHIAAQAADPGIEADASTMKAAQVSTKDSEATRRFIAWSNGRLGRESDTVAEVEAAIMRVNEDAQDILIKIKNLSSGEGAAD